MFVYFLNLSLCSFTRGKVPETPILHKHILIFVQNLWFKKQKHKNHYNTSNVPHIKQHTTAVQRHTHTQVKRAEVAERFYLLRARKREMMRGHCCVLLLVVTAVQGCGHQTGPNPATRAPSSPQLVLRQWHHFPAVNIYTGNFNTDTDKPLIRKHNYTFYKWEGA